VEFVSLIGLPPAYQQAVRQGLGVAVAQAELTAAGLEWQHSGHGPRLSRAIFQGGAQQQQSSAFRHDRHSPSCRGGQLSQAALAGLQPFGMEFWVATRQQDRPGTGGQRLIS
jgi:hypothetical protein